MSSEKHRELLRQALELLGKTGAHFLIPRDGSKDRRGTFVARHAETISKLGDAGQSLLDSRESLALQLVARAALESLFNLTAAIEDKAFAAEKMIFESKEFLRHCEDDVRLVNGDPKELDGLRREIGDFVQEVRSKDGVSGVRKLQVVKCAELALCSSLYPQYRELSRACHSTALGQLFSDSRSRWLLAWKILAMSITRAAVEIVRSEDVVFGQGQTSQGAEIFNAAAKIIHQTKAVWDSERNAEWTS